MYCNINLYIITKELNIIEIGNVVSNCRRYNITTKSEIIHSSGEKLLSYFKYDIEELAYYNNFLFKQNKININTCNKYFHINESIDCIIINLYLSDQIILFNDLL
ncbi:putative ORFan [Cotonvirus japonicus]|uniref:ORFan n=1 Tax=Cotonvirus japonicus TaxID=2811091 RepID=A0ABM7NTL7_9VIRU|nr:putative ORFan [Cotonvirus japonicus]BCS83522.1 putative ORFan [Cotonvirus japonicus]